MRVLVTFAVEAEFAPWLSLRKFQKRTLISDHCEVEWDVFETQRGPNTVWVVLTGMGAEGRKKTYLLGVRAKEAGVDAFISSGLAGALRAEHLVGQVIAPTNIGTLREAYEVAAFSRLLDLAKENGAKIVQALLTSDHIVETREEKARLAFFGDAVDMESNRLMRELSGEGIPSVTVRAISDASDEDLPIDFDQCLSPEGKVKPIPLLQRLVRRPSKIRALVRFGVRSKKAAASLASFLDSFTAALTPEAVRADLGVAAK